MEGGRVFYQITLTGDETRKSRHPLDNGSISCQDNAPTSGRFIAIRTHESTTGYRSRRRTGKEDEF